ncbi:MAG: hypothetical protein IKM00_02190 [Clostridia bacterium]|nr:hypothetical protein [Clostridia bacterium]
MLVSTPMVIAADQIAQSQAYDAEDVKMLIGEDSPAVTVTEKVEQSQEDGTEDVKMLIGEDSPIWNIAENIGQSQEDKLHYVSLGASNTNGYGHHGYLDDEIYEDPLAANKSQMNDYGYAKSPVNAYPALIRDALAQSTGREVALHQLAISSMRVEEVLWLLDDTYEPDEYMDWRFTGGKSWFDMAHKDGGREALRAEYRDYIANADVITVDLGWNNFGVYAFNNAMTILKEDGARYWKAPDLASVIGSDKERVYYAVRDRVIACLGKHVDLSDTALSEDVIRKLVDVFSYAAFGACYNFDKVMDHIYKLNPDAEVVVINIQNLADELIIDMNGLELPLGDFYGELIESVDLYRAKHSPYADKYSFAYAGNDGDVDTFLDEFRRWDGDVATLSQDMKDLFDMYDDNVYARSKIEYVMVGQVFGQIFAQLRNTAASYGLSAFTNDGQYVYEIPEFQMAWLDGIDLASLDFNNPDTGIEEYGAAVSKHLVNLRNYEGEGKDAYNYVFDDLIKYFTGGQIATLDAAIAQRDLILGSVPPEQQNNYADLIQSVTVLEEARTQFNNAFLALYTVYVNTLNYAYDTLGTIIQHTLQFNTFHITSDSMSNHNSKTDELLGYLVNTFTNNTMLKFYEELGRVGLDHSGVVAPEIAVDEELFNDLLIQAVCALEVRYDFGNSFFAHPGVMGNQQIKDAVMDVLTNGSHSDYFVNKKINQYEDYTEELLDSLRKEAEDMIKQKLMRLDCWVDQTINSLAEVNKKIEQYVDYTEESMDSLRKELEEMIQKNLMHLDCWVDQKINDLAEELLDSFCEEVYEEIEKSESIDKIYGAAEQIFQKYFS